VVVVLLDDDDDDDANSADDEVIDGAKALADAKHRARMTRMYFMIAVVPRSVIETTWFPPPSSLVISVAFTAREKNNALISSTKRVVVLRVDNDRIIFDCPWSTWLFVCTTRYYYSSSNDDIDDGRHPVHRRGSIHLRGVVDRLLRR
jgi:hypothetical protein